MFYIIFSMPVVVRDEGKMWNKDDKLEDVKCMIPDRCYAPMYKAVLDDCRENGQFDVATMGKDSNDRTISHLIPPSYIFGG